MKQMRVYLASPFFNGEEKSVYREVISYLRSQEVDVFIPMEHQVKNAWELSNEEWGSRVFAKDFVELKKSDVVLVLNWGMYSDSGTAWECGCAFALGKKVINVCVNPDCDEYSLMMINGCNSSILLGTMLAYPFKELVEINGNTTAEYISVK